MKPENTSGLRKLQALVGDRFVAGVIFYTGPHANRSRDGMLVLPIDRLWGDLQAC